MIHRIRVSEAAAGQIRQAARWWIEHRPRAPAAFAEEVERSFVLLASLPTVGEPVDHPSLPGLRRILLSRVGYHLYYLPDAADGAVDVLALWHTSRGTAPPIAP